MTAQHELPAFTFPVFPHLLFGPQALEHLPYILHQRGISRPAVLSAPDREGSSLLKSISAVLSGCGISFSPISSNLEPLEGCDGIIALGSSSALQAQKLPADMLLILVLTDLQNCTEAGITHAGTYPDYLFLDPATYPRAACALTARTAVSALTILTESLQQDRAHDLSWCYAETGLAQLQKAACRPIRSLSARHAVAEAAAEAALVRSSTGAGTVSSVCMALSSSGFTLPAEASAALLPVLTAQMEKHSSRYLAEAGGSRVILALLKQFEQEAGFPERKHQILSLARSTAELSKHREGGDILRLFDAAGADI